MTASTAQVATALRYISVVTENGFEVRMITGECFWTKIAEHLRGDLSAARHSTTIRCRRPGSVHETTLIFDFGPARVVASYGRALEPFLSHVKAALEREWVSSGDPRPRHG